ncbi:MAG: 2OG-Fe(II) oxygenase family protein [Minwuia sp.]|uniref:2OG-Fe(II) oxygenase family protein n=1 Tax=Minwuia sp. TaxID=2493630 RepID=UPI003A881B63
MSDLPVIDIAPLFAANGDPAAVDSTIADALQQTGGFVVTGFPGGKVLDGRARRLLRFFDMPEARKQGVATRRVGSDRGNTYRGYINLIGDADFATSEMYDIGPFRPRPAPGVRGVEILTEMNAWPAEEPYGGWQREMRVHYVELREVAVAVMLSAGRGLGMDVSGLAAAFHGDNSTMRLLNYPSGRETPAAAGDEPVLASQRHTDGAGVSLLWQREPGLQAEGPDGVWRDVPQYPGSISVHLGDLLEMMTGGRIAATPHRVIDHGGERRSVGFFLEPSLGASVNGSGELCDTYAWRLLERLRSYPSMQDLVPAPEALAGT